MVTKKKLVHLLTLLAAAAGTGVAMVVSAADVDTSGNIGEAQRQAPNQVTVAFTQGPARTSSLTKG